MDSYQYHRYHRLLDFIENGCKRRNEERDFVNYLLSMEKAESIEKLVAIYNNIFKLLAVIIYDTNKMPPNWYVVEHMGVGNAYLFKDLVCYFNENILRLYKGYEKPTEEQLISCLVNLRECDNIKLVQEKLLEGLDADADIEFYESLVAEISLQYRKRNNIERFGKTCINYDWQANLYRDTSKELGGYGRIFDVAEEAFGKEYGFDYNALIDEFKIETEKLREVEEAEKREERKYKWIGIIGAIIILPIIFTLILYIMGFIVEGARLFTIPLLFYLLGVLLLAI